MGFAGRPGGACDFYRIGFVGLRPTLLRKPFQGLICARFVFNKALPYAIAKALSGLDLCVFRIQ